MLYLPNTHFIAEGFNQLCYQHPANKNLCVKVEKGNAESSKRLSNEINHYRRISKKDFKKFDYPFFSKLIEEIDTNLGKGYVFDLVRDETTGKVSKTYYQYLMYPHDNVTDEMLSIAYNKLIDLMGKYKIIANDIRSKNICCRIKKDKSIEMVLIDGIGHRDFLPLVDYFSFFAKKKIARRLKYHSLENIETQRNFFLKRFAKKARNQTN